MVTVPDPSGKAGPIIGGQIGINVGPSLIPAEAHLIINEGGVQRIEPWAYQVLKNINPGLSTGLSACEVLMGAMRFSRKNKALEG